jgi:hypothetical protein
MHQLYHQIPALCAQTIEYLPIYHLYQTYKQGCSVTCGCK